MQEAQGCEDTLKKRGIAAIAIIVIGIVGGMFKGAGIIGGSGIVALLSLIIAPICAAPYRIVNIAAENKMSAGHIVIGINMSLVQSGILQKYSGF